MIMWFQEENWFVEISYFRPIVSCIRPRSLWGRAHWASDARTGLQSLILVVSGNLKWWCAIENQVILSDFKLIPSSMNAMRTILVSQLRPKDLEWRVIHLYLISHSGPWTDEMNFGTFWRHSECDGDLNKLEAGFGMHYIQGIIPGSGEGLFQKIEFVPPRVEMRLKKLNSRRRRRLIHGDKDFIFGGRRNISHSPELQDRRDQRSCQLRSWVVKIA